MPFNKQQAGFTLIELIMVIVLLGILSAFALPRFVSLGKDARVGLLENAMGSVRSAALMARSAQLASGGSKTADVPMEGGVTIKMQNGYPKTMENVPGDTVGGIMLAAQLTEDFEGSQDVGPGYDTLVIKLKKAPDKEKCFFIYEVPEGDSEQRPAVYARTIDGC